MTDFTSYINLIIGHFLIGFTGGYGHCILMCHPFVLHISSAFSTNNAGYKILIPNLFYNIGRIFTYSIMGAIIGGLGSLALTYMSGDMFVTVQKSIAYFGGSVLILFAVMYFLNISSFNFLTKLPVVNTLKKYTPNNPFLYGVILGFLPCGLTVGALIGAMSSSSWYTGASMMAAFGIGTTFAMMTLAVLGSYIMRYVKYFKHITSLLLFFMGIYIIYLGYNFSY